MAIETITPSDEELTTAVPTSEGEEALDGDGEEIEREEGDEETFEEEGDEEEITDDDLLDEEDEDA